MTFSYLDATENEVESIPLSFVGDRIVQGADEQELRSALDELYASLPAPAPPPDPMPSPAPDPMPSPAPQPAAVCIQEVDAVSIFGAAVVFGSFAAIGYLVTCMTMGVDP